jgi:hypothetical protein
VAEVIPRHLESSLVQEPNRASEDKTVGIEKRFLQTHAESAGANTPPAQIAERPHTPVRVSQVLGKISNSRDPITIIVNPPAPSSVNSPLSVHSPSGSVSGKLIQLFEELSRPDTTRTSSAASKSSVGTDPTKMMCENVSTGKGTSFSGAMDGAQDDEDADVNKENVEPPDEGEEHCVWMVVGEELVEKQQETTGSLGAEAKRARRESDANSDGFNERF